MKKQAKKLTLNRETLRQLDQRILQQAAGGDTELGTGCECTWTNCSIYCFIDPGC